MFKRVNRAHPRRRRPVVCVRCRREVDPGGPHWRAESLARVEMCDACHAAAPPRPEWFWDLADSVAAMPRLVFHAGSPWGIRGRIVDDILVIADEDVSPADYADLASERAAPFHLAAEFLQS